MPLYGLRDGATITPDKQRTRLLLMWLRVWVDVAHHGCNVRGDRALVIVRELEQRLIHRKQGQQPK